MAGPAPATALVSIGVAPLDAYGRDGASPYGAITVARSVHCGLGSVLLPTLELERPMIHTAHTGKIGDGKVFVHNLEQVVRIRTGEIGGDAL